MKDVLFISCLVVVVLAIFITRLALIQEVTFHNLRVTKKGIFYNNLLAVLFHIATVLLASIFYIFITTTSYSLSKFVTIFFFTVGMVLLYLLAGFFVLIPLSERTSRKTVLHQILSVSSVSVFLAIFTMIIYFFQLSTYFWMVNVSNLPFLMFLGALHHIIDINLHLSYFVVAFTLLPSFLLWFGMFLFGFFHKKKI
jgi:hypothetical protein